MGKLVLIVGFFSPYATDGIFHHQKRIIPTDSGCPDGFFYSVMKIYSIPRPKTGTKTIKDERDFGSGRKRLKHGKRAGR
jgi:hypothetical protein